MLAWYWVGAELVYGWCRQLVSLAGSSVDICLTELLCFMFGIDFDVGSNVPFKMLTIHLRISDCFAILRENSIFYFSHGQSEEMGRWMLTR